MTFDQTIPLIFSHICIATNLEFDIIIKAKKYATMFRLHTVTNDIYLSKHYTYKFCIYFLLTISILDLTFFGRYALNIIELEYYILMNLK